MITDQAGHRLGVNNGTLVNQIPGAQYQPVISSDTWTNKITPNFTVPTNGTYRLTLDGSALTGPDTETLGIIGPSFAVSVDNISVRPGDQDGLTAAPYATQVSYTASRAQPVTMELGVSNRQADYAFVVSGRTNQPGGTIALGLPAESGSLNMSNSGSDQAATVNLDMSRNTKQSTQAFSHRGIPLAGGNTAQLQFGNWNDPSQGITLATTHDGQQSTQTLSNQATAPTAATPRGPLPSPTSVPSATTPTTMPPLPLTSPPPSHSTFVPPPTTHPIVVPPVNTTTTSPPSPSTTRLTTTTTSPKPTTTTVPRTTTTQRTTTTSSTSTTVEMTTTTCKGGIGTGCCPEPPCGGTSTTARLSSSSSSSAWVVAPMTPLLLGALLWRWRRARRQNRAD
jgi:hypothetical protein